MLGTKDLDFTSIHINGNSINKIYFGNLLLYASEDEAPYEPPVLTGDNLSLIQAYSLTQTGDNLEIG